MVDYNSKYEGDQIEEYLDQLNDLNLGNFATKNDIDAAIAAAITTTINADY